MPEGWVQHPECKILYRSESKYGYLGRFGEVGAIMWNDEELCHFFLDQHGREYGWIEFPYNYITGVSLERGLLGKVGGLWIHTTGFKRQERDNGVYFSQEHNAAAEWVRSHLLELITIYKGIPRSPHDIPTSRDLDDLAELEEKRERGEISLAVYAARRKDLLEIR